jgi:acyl dehydratase
MPGDAVSDGLVGRELEPVPWSWGPEQVMLYALGVGAEPERDLPFIYEGAGPLGPLTLPTFGTVPTGASFLSTVGQLGLELGDVLHAEQSLTLYGPLPPTGQATVRRRVAEVWDKGTGAIVVIEETATAAEPLFLARSSWWVAGAGGFGGERGPRARSGALPDRPPDMVSRRVVTPAQAALYRLSGDRNPIHIDPAFARASGYSGPFLHGLCTYGMAGLELVGELCSGDPGRLRELHARFASPVWPGDDLTVEAWVTDPETVLLRVAAGGRLVIAPGWARITA